MAKMTEEQKQDFFNEYGVMPITDDDIPESGKIFLTPDQILEAEKRLLQERAKTYLKETDWYVVRKSETGADIPADVLEKRTQARIDASG